ncbi:MAG: hypothetical protein AAF487_08990 [Bacteroidota bacterium]
MKQFLLLFGFLISANSFYAQDMNNEELHKVILEMSDSIEGELGHWSFLINGIPLYCISDVNHNRMRIISPIAEMKDLKKEHKEMALKANFHSALDVRYAESDGIMWVAFIHPLKELNNEQVKDAIKQVFAGAVTFGTTYTSTDLVFPGSGGEEPKEKEEEIERS